MGKLGALSVLVVLAACDAGGDGGNDDEDEIVTPAVGEYRASWSCRNCEGERAPFALLLDAELAPFLDGADGFALGFYAASGELVYATECRNVTTDLACTGILVIDDGESLWSTDDFALSPGPDAVTSVIRYPLPNSLIVEEYGLRLTPG